MNTDQSYWADVNDEFDVTMAGLLPTPAEEGASLSDTWRVDSMTNIPPSPMHRIYRQVIEQHDGQAFDIMEDLTQRVMWAEDQTRRASANATAHFKLAQHRGHALQWLLANYDLDELAVKVIEYACTQEAGQ